MNITIDELKRNLNKYLELVPDEDINIFDKGKKIAILTKPKVNKQEVLDSLVGFLPCKDINLEKIKAKRLKRKNFTPDHDKEEINEIEENIESGFVNSKYIDWEYFEDLKF